MSEVNRGIQNVINLYSNADDIGNNIGKLKKLLFECSVKDGYQINNVIDDISNIITEGYKFSEYIKNPNKITCLASALLGISLYVSDRVKRIKLDISSYTKNLLPMVNQIYKDIIKEFSFSEITTVFEKRLDEYASATMDIGLGYVQGFIDEKLGKYEDYVYNAIAQVGRYLGFLMVASDEFRWAMYMVTLNNAREQINTRINSLIELKQKIRNLVYEIDEGNAGGGPELHTIILSNYIASLQILEDTVPITKQIEQRLIFASTFLSQQNDTILGNIGNAKKLLIAERNKFLEKILEKQEVNFNPKKQNMLFFCLILIKIIPGLKYIQMILQKL